MPEGQTSEPAIAEATRALARSWRWVWVALELALAIVCVQLPLFGVLGYELALVATVLGSIASLDLGAALARRAARVAAPALARARDPIGVVARLAARAALIALAVTAIPAALAAVNGLFAPTCDWGFGIRAYLSMVSLGAVIFAIAGVALGLATARARAWVPAVIGVALVLAIAGAGVWRFYAHPPVFTYSALVGYFPGNMYDEHIRLGAPLYWSRLEELAWAIGALALVTATLDGPTLAPRLRERRPATGRRATHAACVGALGVALGLHLAGGALGHAVDADDLQAALSGTRVTDHFVIHYAETEEIERDIDLIAEDHEIRLAQVAETLGLDDADLRRMGPIRSYYFRDADQKAALMGARGVEMAKPWRREIYLTHGGFPVRALRHEIAHAVAGEFGDPWFGVSARRVLGLPLMVNPGLVEGLAVAVDWPGNYDRMLTPHEAVRAMQEMGVQPGVGKVMGLGFLSLSSTSSYTTAGSFLRFLLDREGPRAVRALYASGGDFEAVLGRSLAELEAEWREMIAGVTLAPGQIEAVRELYRRGGLFARRCPHATAAKRAEALEAAARGDRRGAIRAYREVCRDSGEQPRDRLALAVLLIGSEDHEVPAPERAEGVAILRDVAGDDDHATGVRADALEALAHVAAIDGDLAAAEALLAEAAALPVDDGSARQLEAKLAAIRHAGPAGAALRTYFFAPEADRLAAAEAATRAEPLDGLGWYLRGLQRRSSPHRDFAGAAHDLATALALPLPSQRFVRNAARQLAVAGWRAGDRAAVERAIEVLERPEQPAIDRLLAEDWRYKLAWREARATSR